jgi:hypothetical protein
VICHVPPMTHDAASRKQLASARAWLVGLGVFFALIAALGLAYYAGVMSLESAPLWGPS